MTGPLTPIGPGDDELGPEGTPIRPGRGGQVDRHGPAGAWDGAPPHPNRQPPPEDTIELREVFLLMRRRIWLILLFMFLGGGLAFFLHQRQVPQYRAQAVVRIEDPSQVMGAMAPGGWSYTDPVLSALEVLRSQSVLGRIVDEEGLRLSPLDAEVPLSRLEGIQILDDAPSDTITLRFEADAVLGREARRSGQEVRVPYGQELVLGSVRLTVPARPEVPEARFYIQGRQEAIRSLEGGLSAQLREYTDVVDVEFVSPDPELSRRVVNRAVEAFRERSTEQARRESMRRRAFLEEQLAQVDSTLQQTQQALSDFRSREQVFSSRDWIASQQAGLMDIDMRREELQAERSMYAGIVDGLRGAQVGEIANRLETLVASPSVAGNPVVSSLYSQLTQYETARDSILSGPWGASPESPDVLWADQQIRQTRDRLERAVRSHLEAQDARIEALTQLRARTAQRIGSLPETEAEEFRLLQQVESVRRTVDELTSEYYRAQVAEAVEEGAVEIVDRAPLPVVPEQSSFRVMLALGLLLGFMLGSGGAFLMEMLNTSIRHQEDLEDSLKVSMVGMIPRLPKGSQRVVLEPGSDRNGSRKRSSSRKKTLKQRVLLPGETLGAAPAGNGAPGVAAGGNGDSRISVGGDLITVHDQKSAPAEAFRSMRTNLLFARDRTDLKTLVVTSALPKEGKSTTAANLAITYAQQGYRVLVIDCDLRRPRLAELFGMNRKPGMTEWLLGEARSEEVIQPFEPVKGLFVLTGGTLPSNPTELLGGARMRRALKLLRDRFDFVLVDTPPLSAGADAAVLGSAVDGVLMVVKAGETDRRAAKMAAGQLHTVGANLVGAVLNDPGGEMPKYGYYYYAYQYYGEY